MKITIPAKPEPVTLDADKTALIVVDMQNSFCKKGGMMDFFGKLDGTMTDRVIAVDKKVIETFRAKKRKIFYLRMTYRVEESPDSPFYWKEAGLVALRKNPALKGKFLTQETWDWNIIDELKPGTKDIIVNKSRFSGFVNTELDTILKINSIKYLVFIGLFTNICVESTARDAFSNEYFPIVVEDACGSMGSGFIQDATIWNIASAFGWVVTSDDLIKSFS